MSERKLVSTHIAKAGGTSIQGLYEKALGRDQIAIYLEPLDQLRRGSQYPFSKASPFTDWLKSTALDSPFYPQAKDLAIWLGSLRNPPTGLDIPEGVRVLHGHFSADRFDSIIEDPLRSIVLREPLERTRAAYDHWRRAKGRTEWLNNLPFDPTVTFEDYALSEKLQNYQAQAISGKTLSAFDVVGVTDDLESFGNKLLELFIQEGWCDRSVIGNVSIPNFNRTPSRRKTSVPQPNTNFAEEFRRFHNEDYQLYHEARRIAGLS
ncbi:MAG: hypothetical protein KGJ07_00890 [Patescibacteria group bacterium]|nr:hypothetical protein [Patescibacteria group bacterium]MDE2588577.1 hypothetical protein [Patescibacteria group bacterium]